MLGTRDMMGYEQPKWMSPKSKYQSMPGDQELGRAQQQHPARRSSMNSAGVSSGLSGAQEALGPVRRIDSVSVNPRPSDPQLAAASVSRVTSHGQAGASGRSPEGVHLTF